MPSNDVKSFIDQQCGVSLWQDSRAPISRLRCSKSNSYTQLLPVRDDDTLYRDTPIFTCKFSPQQNNEHLLALANEDGNLAIHDTKGATRYGIHAHNNAIFDLAWMFNQMKLVTASGDHSSKLYDVADGDIRQERMFCGHTRSVKTVAFRKDDTSVFATGGRDGNIILWDTRSECSSFVGKADRTISNSHTSKVFTPSKSRKKFSTPTHAGIKSVTGLVFQENNTLISCGAGDGIIKIWDLRKNYVTYKKEAAPKCLIPYPGNTTKNGYSNLIIDNEGIKLYANCLDNTIYCYNISTYNTEPVMRYRGHQNNTFYVKSSLRKDGNYLVSGSSDENAYIWHTKHSEPVVKLTGHTAEVTCVAWCDTNYVLITCSDDMTHKIWTVGTEEIPDDWVIEGKGLAETLPLNTTAGNVKLKRSWEGTEEFTPKRIFIECIKCENAMSSKFCENCTNTSKRKATDELEHENKMLHTDFGPRRLFANICNTDTTEVLATNLTDIELAEEYQPPSKLPKLEDISEKTADTSLNDVDHGILNTFSRTNIPSSPTVNLPNYIVDGTAPHLTFSPPKKKSHDWLTKLRIENQLRKEMYDKTVGLNNPKQPKLELTRCKRSAAVTSPLLKYFKVTNNAQKCDGLVCSKFHACSGVDVKN